MNLLPRVSYVPRNIPVRCFGSQSNGGLVDQIQDKVERLAGPCGWKNECPRRIHYALLPEYRGPSQIIRCQEQRARLVF